MARHIGGVPFTVASIRAAVKVLEKNELPKNQPVLIPIDPGSPIDVEMKKFLGEPKASKKRAVGISDSKFLKVLDETTAMLANGEWAKAEGKHFVALYAELHFKVYGVEDSGLGSKERVYASSLARNMLEKDFRGIPGDMANFVAWTWSREKGKEEWRREQGVSRGRLTWRTQFSRALLTDFRVEVARKKAAGR